MKKNSFGGKTWNTILSFLVLFVFLSGTAFAEADDIPEMQQSSTLSPDESGIDHEEAAAQYIYRTLNWSQMIARPMLKLRGGIAGDRLDTVSRKLYNVLKTKITSVAAGELSSTVFAFSMSEIGVDDGQIEGLFNSVDKVLSALVADCPYELYWFDKIAHYYYNLSYDGTLSVSLPVAEAYAKSRTQGTYEFDTSLIQTVQKAAKVAQNIVSANANKSDIEKLQAYKDAICDLTDYNDAAAEDSSMPYGDPWQLVYVFDENPDTTVVCEGYSKAFQYLCDLSTFNNVSVISVSGYMQGGNSGADHMWNIVSANGKNYLADITNSDSDSAGSDGSLFMAGYQEYNAESEYYSYTADNQTFYYWYDEDMYNVFGESNLVMSETNYTVLMLPANLQIIEDEAFANIKNVTVILPSSLKTVSPSAFDPSVIIKQK